MSWQVFSYAFLLSLAAGLATGIGSILAFFTRRTATSFLSLSLGFSAGVMLYVAFVGLLPQAREALTAFTSSSWGSGLTAAAFFAGLIGIGVIDYLVPGEENPHQLKSQEVIRDFRLASQQRGPAEPAAGINPRLRRLGLLVAAAITLHNIPEGLAIFTSALVNPMLGVSVAVAIGLHNIVEGITVSVPIFYATGNRRRAFALSFLSGLAEPLGALLGFAVLGIWFSARMMGFLFGIVAGIMVYLALDELLPAAREYGQGHLAIWGAILGMAAMASTLLLFQF